MVDNNIDYAICIYHSGFSRERGNYGAQIAKGFAIGLLTLGMYYTTPIKASSNIFICILDRRNLNIALYGKNLRQDFEPGEKKNTDRQLNKIFDKYLGTQ
jgi:hypothetical protein